MKLKTLILGGGLFSSVALLSITSCQQESSISMSTDEIEEAVHRIGFAQNAHSLYTISARNTVGEDSIHHLVTRDDGKLDIILRLYRRPHCIKGFSICEVRVAPSSSSRISSYVNGCKDYAYSMCKIDFYRKWKNKHYLKNTPESQGLSEKTMPALVINEEIEQPLESDPTKELLIKKGSYPYNKTLGKFGGYSIDIEYENNH